MGGCCITQGALGKPRGVGWDGGVEGKSKREGTHVYLGLIHIGWQQKPTQHCKAIILKKKNQNQSLSLYITNINLYHCLSKTDT